MGAGKKVYTYVSFSSQNNSNFMGVKILQIITTIKFLKNKLVQRSPFRHRSEMKGLGTGGEKMVTSGEVLSLATPQGATLWKFWFLWVSRWLENAFTTIVDFKMVSDTDAHTKSLLQSSHTFK